MKTLQLYNPKAVEIGRKMTAEEIARFLEDFRLMHAQKQQPSQAISLRVSVPLLNAFRFQCEQQGLKYQSQIKHLMQHWLEGENSK